MTGKRRSKPKPKRTSRAQTMAVARAALARESEQSARPSLRQWWGAP